MSQLQGHGAAGKIMSTKNSKFCSRAQAKTGQKSLQPALLDKADPYHQL
jgi:hypothetical protein